MQRARNECRSCESCNRGVRGSWVGRMIGKDYFKRQATTLRKMIGVAQDKVVATRLTSLADDFEAKADEEPEPPKAPDRPPNRGAADSSGH